MSRSSAGRRTGRRHPFMGVALLVLGLFATGGLYAATSAGIAQASTPPVSTEALIDQGENFSWPTALAVTACRVRGAKQDPPL